MLHQRAARLLGRSTKSWGGHGSGGKPRLILAFSLLPHPQELGSASPMWCGRVGVDGPPGPCAEPMPAFFTLHSLITGVSGPVGTVAASALVGVSAGP